MTQPYGQDANEYIMKLLDGKKIQVARERKYISSRLTTMIIGDRVTIHN